SGRTARAAIAEYRRFLYLSALKQGRTVPTKAVDEVWHLHLTHTKDYWETFVPNALGGAAIHHTPGSPDSHVSDFRATRARYEAEFDEDPPKGFWAIQTRRGALLSQGVMVAFGSLFLWIGLTNDAPWPWLAIVLLFLVLATTVFVRSAATSGGDGNTFQFGIDIWADGEGGDCGDCGGGCGD
ncbi:MAG: hypothetical protein AAGK57_11200, partial [Pseudomonadota bacterium]